MREKKQFADRRVKKRLFPISTFISVFFAFAVFTTIQMKILGESIDAANIPKSNEIAIFVVWLLSAAAFTLWTNIQITRHYQKPIEEFSEAARKVASGDFSVYLAPHHTADKSTHLDVLFADFDKMVEELGSIETLKTDFFSNVSHEIKTPLAIIQNNAELLQKESLTDEQRKEYAETICHATKRLSNLITNMLKLNKLEKQAIQPQPQIYDVCEQLCSCALQFEDMWEDKGIEFIADIEDCAKIEADAELMDLVWTNLLSNALKFTPPGGTITLLQTSEPEEVMISIKDTGCGIDEETLCHIFDKFYQGDTSHSTEGNGLGLALVQRILQLSDGSITVDSTEGKARPLLFGCRYPIARRLDEESCRWKREKKPLSDMNIKKLR